MSEVRYCLRFPDGIRDNLKLIATQNRRSMHSEIVERISRVYDAGIDLSVYSSMGERHADKTILRLDAQTHAELKQAAQAKARSLNAEINYRLLASLEGVGEQPALRPMPVIHHFELLALRKTVAGLLAELDRIIDEDAT